MSTMCNAGLIVHNIRSIESILLKTFFGIVVRNLKGGTENSAHLSQFLATVDNVFRNFLLPLSDMHC